jgi:hypothetical protein
MEYEVHIYTTNGPFALHFEKRPDAIKLANCAWESSDVYKVKVFQEGNPDPILHIV